MVSSRLPICQFGSILVTKYQLLYLRRFETDFDNFKICFRAIWFLSIPLLFIEISMDKSSLCAVILEQQFVISRQRLMLQDHSAKAGFLHWNLHKSSGIDRNRIALNIWQLPRNPPSNLCILFSDSCRAALPQITLLSDTERRFTKGKSEISVSRNSSISKEKQSCLPKLK